MARGCRVGSGDDQIYRKHKDDLIRFATTLVGPHRAEDVLSTVILRVLRRRSLSDLEDPRAYLFRAVLNEARGVLRKTRRVVLVDPGWSDPEVDLELADAVMRLPARQRAAVYLVYVEDLTIAAAAELMGIRPGTVKRYLHLARRRLKGMLS